MKTNPSEELDVLKNAKTLIERAGWGQNAYSHKDQFRRNCNYCTVGAVIACLYDEMNCKYSSDGFFLRVNVCARIADAAGLQYPITNNMLAEGLVTRWNDDQMRTKEDVFAVIDRAIQTVEQEIRNL